MITFAGKKYLTTKEASKKYGLQIMWFIEGRRRNKGGPPFMKFKNSNQGHVYYDEVELEEWLKNNLVRKGTN